MICEKCEALNALIDGYRRERDEARGEIEVLRASIEGEPWGAAVLKQERDEARAEVERLRAEAAPMNEHFTAGYRDGYRDAYRRGAEAMRERCAMEVRGKFLGTNSDLPRIEVAVRIEAALLALPIPEEP